MKHIIRHGGRLWADSVEGQDHFLRSGCEWPLFYQLSPNVQTHLLRLIAGKPQAEAQQILLQQPGIATVSFTVSGGLGTALPGDAKTIQVRITG